MPSRFVLRLRALFQKAGLEQELDEEVRFHLEREVEENVRRGISPAEARRAAMIDFGGVEGVKEQCRDARGVRLLEDFWQDLRYGARTLRKNPGLTFVAILTMTLAIGANTAIFSVVNAVVLRPLPFKDAAQLVAVSGAGLKIDGGSPSPDLTGWREQTQAFDDAAAYVTGDLNLGGVEEPERVPAAQVSANFFSILGAGAARGRTFLAGEDRPGHNQVVVVSHGLWQRRFNSDPALIGQNIKLNGAALAVIGITLPDFAFPSAVDLWVPLGVGNDTIFRGAIYYSTIARLKPGVSVAQSRAELKTVARRAQVSGTAPAGMRSEIEITGLHEKLVGDHRSSLLVLLGAVGLVLLIACSNIANLLLARCAARAKEFAVRNALGAKRSRLICQVLTESTLISLLGGVGGALLAWWSISLLLSINPVNLPAAGDHVMDWRVLVFTLTLSVSTGLCFGLLPALQSSRTDLTMTLREASRNASAGLRHNRLRGVLVVGEVALSVVLLVGAGLLIKSFVGLHRVETGFRAENILTMEVSLPRYKYARGDQRAAFYREVLNRLRSQPGVEAAGVVNNLPLGEGWTTRFGVTADRRDASAEENKAGADYRVVSPDYFRALGIRLLAGRFFTDRDAKEAPKVAIVNENLAKLLFPREEPIGKRINLDAGKEPTTYEIVGVVGDVRHYGLSAGTEPELYLSYLQSPTSAMTVVVHTKSDPGAGAPAVRAQILAVDPEQPVANVRTMDEVVARSTAPQSFNALLMGAFALVALALASVGMYGVVSYAVAQRTHEIGIRMALGAQKGDVLRLVVGRGMLLAAAGIIAGVVAALALTRLLAGLLYGVGATDLTTFAVTSLLLATVALVACWVPARRATRIDPLTALRYE